MKIGNLFQAGFWSLLSRLIVFQSPAAFALSRMCRSRNRTCNRWQSQIPHGLNKDPNDGSARRCLWAHAGQRESRINARLVIMADATTRKLFWGTLAGQFWAEMDKSTCKYSNSCQIWKIWKWYLPIPVVRLQRWWGGMAMAATSSDTFSFNLHQPLRLEVPRLPGASLFDNYWAEQMLPSQQF